MYTAVKFADELGISYPTIVRWLKLGLVPGAQMEETLTGNVWQIPESSLKMEKPMKPGPKKGSKRKAQAEQGGKTGKKSGKRGNQ